MPPTRCRRSAASASTSRSRTRSRPPTSSPGRWRAARTSIRCCTRSRSGACFRPGSSRPARRPRRTRIIGRVLGRRADHQRAAGRSGCSTASRCCGGSPAGSSASASAASGCARPTPGSGGRLRRRHRRFEVLADRLEELLGRHPRLLGADQDARGPWSSCRSRPSRCRPARASRRSGPPRACRRTCRGYLRPPVQAKIEAIGLVEVALPCWCMR